MPYLTNIQPNAHGQRARAIRIRTRVVVLLGVVSLAVVVVQWPVVLLAVAIIPVETMFTALAMSPHSEAAATVFAAAALLVGMAILVLAAAVPYAAIARFTRAKHVVVYLRRFRLSRTHRMLSAAIESGLGRRYRFVTLDDQSFTPIEVPTIERRLTRYAAPTFVVVGIGVLVLGIVLGALLWFRYGISLTGLGVLGLTFAAFSAPIVMPVLFPMAGTAMVAFSTVLAHRRRIRARSRVTVTDAATLASAVRDVRSLGASIRSPAFMAPQATVVTVVDGMWQQVVEELATIANAFVVDVSAVTPNVAWELDLLQTAYSDRVVFIADAAMLQHAVEHAGAMAVDDTLLRHIVERHPVLLYESGWMAARRLRRNVRIALENMGSVPASRPSAPALTTMTAARQFAIWWLVGMRGYLPLWLLVSALYCGAFQVGCEALQRIGRDS